MKYISCLFALLLFASVAIAQSANTLPVGNEKVASSNIIFEQELLVLINKERKKRRLRAVKLQADLTNAARYHAEDMGKQNYFEHSSMYRTGGKLKELCGPFDRIRQFTKGNVFASSENIAAGQQTPSEVLESWMTSSGHRKNILNKSNKFMGLGYVEVAGSEYGGYWVQIFGN